ncbi:hypothetical protein [Sphingosinicella sp. BN140058]|uniref:hypothetical protein n=1 Tax=Sphingosinicella sp. BN140058 TaxID=1892855 RepID=UPI001013AE61|nr:hypothetical protein [Sphingosinicella sp. BN140058]QAY78396.1 hypothetical protein ETR14_19035 [Sphingosinicella sp. BN140058]
MTLKYLGGFRDKPDLFPLACFARACLLLATAESADAEQACEEAEAMARTVLGHPNANSLQLDPLLLVSHFEMLANAGCETPQMRELVQLIADEVAQLPPDVRSSGRAGQLVRLLANHGFAPGSGGAPGTQPLPADEFLLLQSSDAIQELIEQLSGTSVILSQITAELLSLIALSELRDYRLDCGIRILRFLIDAGWNNIYLAEAIRFVALQRTVAGTYGFVNPLVQDELDGERRDSGLHLPNTLNAVWLFKVVADRARSADAHSPRSAVAV